MDTPAASGAGPDTPPPAPASPASWATWSQRLGEQPYRFELFQALRHIDSAHPQLPRLGTALRPADEPLRVVQPPELDFPTAAVTGWKPGRIGTRMELHQRVFGLLGPNGALPMHLTELCRDRAYHNGDHGPLAFVNLLSHRFALLFYRAWAQAHPEVGLDRPGRPDVARWLGALCGIGEPSQSQRDALGDAPKLAFVGRLARQVRDADGLQAWCHQQFRVPLKVLQWCGHWMALDPQDRSRLSLANPLAIGRGATLGRQVWDVQHKFRIEVGPLRLPEYRRFLPDGPDLRRLQAMVRQWVGLEFAWDVKLVLARQDVPCVRLGGEPAGACALGRTSWLGQFRRDGDASDLVMDVEHILRPGRLRATRPAAPRQQPPAQEVQT